MRASFFERGAEMELFMANNSRISYDQFGNMLVEGIAVSIRQNSYKVSDAFKSAIKNIELQFETSAISEQEYYKNMEKIRNTHLQKGTKEWWTYTNKIISNENRCAEEQAKALEKQLKEEEKALAKAEKERLSSLEKEKNEIQKVYSDIAKTIYKTQEEILREQQKFADKLSNFAQPAYDIKTTFVNAWGESKNLSFTSTNLSDLEAQKKELKNYYDLLVAVKERGAKAFGKEGFAEFFDMLRGFSIEEGSALSSLLLKENDEGFQDFVGDWNEIQELTRSFSKNIYEDDTNSAIDESFEYMKKSLEAYGLEIPEGFFTSGSIAADKFGEGFVAQIDTVMQEITERFGDLLPQADTYDSSQKETAVSSSVFSPVYNLYGSGETTIQKLRTAAAQAIVDRLRGGY